MNPNKPIAYVFFVSEAEYPALQVACPNDFPATYREFVARVDQGVAQNAHLATVVKAHCSVEEFLAWCAQAEVQPNNLARSRYAMIQGARQALH